MALTDASQKVADGGTTLGVGGALMGGREGAIIGGLATVAGLIAQITTGSGFRPFGKTIIPKQSPPPGC